MDNPSSNRVYQKAVILTCFVFTVGLFAYALIGTTSRYLQDDYCYSVILGKENFFISQYNSYLYQTNYSGNRFSLTLGMGLSELAGQGSVTVLPGLMLVVWGFGLYFVIRLIFQQNALVRLSRLEAFISAEALALFTLSITPNWIQSFLWRAGMFPYFAPIVTGTYLILLIVVAGQAQKRRPLLFTGIFLLAVLTGGFSETAVCVEVVLLVILFGITCALKNARGQIALPAGIAVLGSITAMALLIASPTNGTRLAMAYGAASSPQTTLVNSLENGIYFYIVTAYRPTLLYASPLLFFGLLGFITASRRERPTLSWKQFLVGVCASILIAYLLTAAAMAPSFYAESSYPGKRALIIPAFVSILLAGTVGLLTGSFLSNWAKERRFLIVPVLAGVGIIFIHALWLSGMSEHFYPPAYPDMRSFLKQNIGFGIILVVISVLMWGMIVSKWKTRTTFALLMILYLIQPGLMGARILHEYPILQRRAELWDSRQAQIIQAHANGERELEVRALDSLADLTDLSLDPGYWVNHCAADYYGLTSIRGVEPVLNPEPLVNP